MPTDQAIAESVRWLLEQQELVRAPRREPLPTPIVGGGGAPTVVVAGAESTSYSKGRADFLCDGSVADKDIIQRALNICSVRGGLVWLCEGGYQIEIPTTGPALIIPPRVALTGVGPGLDGAGTSLEMSNLSNPGRVPMVEMQGDSSMRGITLYTFDSAFPLRFKTNHGLFRVSDCWFDTNDGGAIEGEGNDILWIERCVFVSHGNHVAEEDSMIHLIGQVTEAFISRNYIGQGWHGIFLEGVSGKNFIHDNFLIGNFFSGIRVKSDALPIFATSIQGNTIVSPGVGSDGSTGDAAIYVSGDPADIDPLTTQSNGVVISANKIEASGATHAIRLGGIALALVHGNYIETPGLHGIFLEDANQNTIFANMIQEPAGFPDGTIDGIHLVTSDRNYLSANTVIERGGGSPATWRYGINISDAASGANIVVGNDLRLAGSGTGFLNNAGTGTLLVYPGGAAGDNFV